MLALSITLVAWPPPNEEIASKHRDDANIDRGQAAEPGLFVLAVVRGVLVMLVDRFGYLSLINHSLSLLQGRHRRRRAVPRRRRARCRGADGRRGGKPAPSPR